MPLFRRRSAKSKIVRCAAQTTVEALERRTLYTAVINGRFSGSGTGFDGTTVFEYRQGNGNAPIRISITGNITAEFIGASAGAGNSVILSDLVPVTTLTSTTFLFSIYIVHADLNSAISIAQVPDTNVAARPMQPFGGGIAVRFINATDGSSTVVTTTDGGAFIGCETPNNLAPPFNSTPIIVSDETSFGLRPASAGVIFAGLQTAPHVSLGKFFLGGTITGKVDVGGSMDTFYAGNILTGDARGIPSTESEPSIITFPVDQSTPVTELLTDNFHVGGSIHNLITAHSFGTITLTPPAGLTPDAVVYKTGFQLNVGGRVGQMYALDSFLGAALITDSATFKEPGGPQREVEVRGANQAGSVSYFDPQYFGYDISLGDTANDARFFNDTFATAQYLGTSRSIQAGGRDVIQLLGNLANFGSNGTPDPVDYYAVSLMAGQVMDVTLSDLLNGVADTFHPRLGIFDPDGRLIATDYSNLGIVARLGKTIRITADRPGAYRIAVGYFGDVNFNGVADAASATSPAESITRLLGSPYEIQVTRTGDISLGGLIANGSIATMDVDARGIEVIRGDIGEIRSGAAAANLIFSFSEPWIVRNGNLRAMEAVNMGINSAPAGGAATYVDLSGPDFQVLRGSVGLLRTTGVTATSAMIINDGVFSLLTVDRLYPVASDDLSQTPGYLAVGKDIQLVDCAGTLEGDLLAKGGIGVIRALNVGGLISPGFISSPVWQVNVDRKGNDGIIDLIDVTGDVISPAIMTGPGGNVRYFHVSTDSTVVSDTFFGGQLDEDTLYAQGQKVTLTDDSGTTVTLIPTPLDPNTTLPLPVGSSGFLDPPRLDVLALPIRGSGGSVILRVTVIPTDDTTDGVVRTGGAGLTIQSGGNGPNGGVEIGEIVRGTIPGVVAAAAPAGNTFTFDPFNRVYTPTVLAGAATDPRDVNFTFGGKSRIDIWNINDTFATDTITNIVNQTGGEIANIINLGAGGVVGGNAPDIFNLQAKTIGLAESHTGTAVEGRTVLDNTLPFVNARRLVRIADVNTIRAREGLGNLLLDNAVSVIANSDGANNKNEFEGINGPLVIRQPGAGTSQLTGNLVSVNIGEGVLPSGTGTVVRSGIFVDGVLDSLVGKNADIRGIVDAAGLTTVVTQQAVDPTTGLPLTNPDGTPLIVSTPTFNIGKISLENGSIIDAAIMNVPVNQTPATFFATRTISTVISSFNNPTFQIRGISLKGNGGILGSFFVTSNLGPINVEGGFGVFGSLIQTTGGSLLQGITTDGYGIRNTRIQTSSVRNIIARGNGNAVSVDTFSPRVQFSDKTTIDPYSGLELDEFNDLNKALGTTAAKPNIKGVTNTGWLEDDVFLGGRDLGNVEAQRIFARDTLVTDPATGVVSRVAPGSALYPMRFSFGNSTGTMLIRDAIDGLTLNTGSLKSLTVSNGIQRSSLNISGHVKSILAGRIWSNTSIQISGPDGTLDSIKTRGDLAPSRLEVSQDILSINVGGNLASKLVKTGQDLESLYVKGSILTGTTVQVADTLNNLFVGGDIKAGAVIKAHRIIRQTINGQVSGDIIIT